jgi:hypothetical protein
VTVTTTPETESNPVVALRRAAVVGICSACAGQGYELNDDLEQIECAFCYGHGDLDAARLIAAYECGRQDTLALLEGRVTELKALLDAALELLHGPSTAPTYRQLRARVGG